MQEAVLRSRICISWRTAARVAETESRSVYDEMSRTPKNGVVAGWTCICGCWRLVVRAANGAAGVTQAGHDKTRHTLAHTHSREREEAGGPMAESAGADLLTVVRRLLGWYHAAKTQQVADGAGRSSSMVAFCGLTNRVRLPLAREFLVRYVGDNPACSSPVVSVPAPVSGYPRQISCFWSPFARPLFLVACGRADVLDAVCNVRVCRCCRGNAGKQAGKSPADRKTTTRQSRLVSSLARTRARAITPHFFSSGSSFRKRA